mgnify:CR=1 FL=1
MLIMKGRRFMKLLRINDKKGEYSTDGSSFKLIDTISREDIELMMEIIMDKSQTYEFDDPRLNEIVVPSQKLIYKKIYEKFKELLDKRDSIMAKVNSSFKEAFEKYNS